MGTPVLEMKNISKSYSGGRVLKNISFVLEEGEILGLVGENGAGKSTLMKILSGGTQPNEGEIILDGRLIEITNPIVAKRLRIAMVQQELSLISSLTVTDNIVLGQEKRIGPLRTFDRKANEKYARQALKAVDLDVSLDAKVGTLSVANQQMIEIARNLIQEPRVLILDEPTTALTLMEAEYLLRQMILLKEKKTSIIFISHKLEEIMKVCDRMIVLRDGNKEGEVKKDEITRPELIKLMVGDREFFKRKSESKNSTGDVILETKNLSKKNVFSNISFQLHKGEVLGFFGLKGAGRSELFHSIFGADSVDGGEIFFEHKKVNFNNPGEAIKAGIGLVSEDRKFSGILPNMDVKDNILISNLMAFSNSVGVIREKSMQQMAESFIDKLKIKVHSVNQPVKRLSGGNQQKTMISRWLHTDSKILIFDEPTKGVDVGAKQDIYAQIKQFTEEGKGIVVISSELEEVMLVSDRIAVMKQGKIDTLLEGTDVDADVIMHHAAG
jgi:ribose transport system ATP-binding protein